MTQKEKFSSEDRITRLEQTLDAISKSWCETESPSTHSLKIVNMVDDLAGSGLVRKLQSFTAGLDEDELKDMSTLFAPILQAAQTAAKNPVRKEHTIPNSLLEELKVKLASGEIFVGGQGPALITPTITTVTITTTVASHPIIGCNIVAADVGTNK